MQRDSESHGHGHGNPNRGPLFFMGYESRLSTDKFLLRGLSLRDHEPQLVIRRLCEAWVTRHDLASMATERKVVNSVK